MKNEKENVVGTCFVGQDLTGRKTDMNKYTHVYVGIMRNPSTLIPPIFTVDEFGRCLEWNNAMQKLTGMKREQAIDRMLLGEVFTLDKFGCRVKYHYTLTNIMILFNGITVGGDANKLLFGFIDQQGKFVEVLLSANRRTDVNGRISGILCFLHVASLELQYALQGNFVKVLLLANRRTNADGRITGILCFLHVASPELQYALQVQRMSEQAAASSLNKLAYIRQELRKPLKGVILMQDLMGSSDLSREQRQLLRTSVMCQQ
ncbi:hypothetical protein V6N12_007458 [Hibiscus sabdariffa]|uniref:PAS domain-containing protein n=1 Tax=Hibiscus sabdariffa TaxID=183260 RepID=A0ABR2F1U8_9ROSI